MALVVTLTAKPQKSYDNKKSVWKEEVMEKSKVLLGNL
jgi:hypothetical protein